MTIKINSAASPEVLVYDRIFMVNMSISQVVQIDNSLPPKYNVSIQYKIYAVDSSGNKVFDNTLRNVSSLDYYGDAMTKNRLGDSSFLDSIVAIEKAMSVLISDKGNVGNTRISV